MKSIVRLAVLMLLMVPVIGFAQSGKTAPWPEMKAFHSLMSSTFHPTEEGNFAPLKQKADSLLIAAKAWQASKIPSNYKEKETTETLKKLVEQLVVLQGAVEAKAVDEKLKVLISDAHDIFHKIVGECRKTE